MGKCPQPRLRIDALTGEWRNGEAGEGRSSKPCEPGGLRHQAGGASWRAPLGSGGEDITWPDQVAPRGRNPSSTREIKPQASNPFLVVTRESQSPCTFLLLVNAVQFLFRCHDVFIYLADIGNRVLFIFPFFSQYAVAFIPSVELLVPVEDCWCFRGGHNKRCVKCQFIEVHCVCAVTQKATLQQVALGFPTSPRLRRSGHPPKQHSVHCRNPVVSAACCLLCFPLLPPASGQTCHHVTAISGFNNESESKGDSTSEIRLTERIRPVLWYDPNPFNSNFVVTAKSQILVPLDVAVAIPVDAYAQIASRSGFAVR